MNTEIPFNKEMHILRMPYKDIYIPENFTKLRINVLCVFYMECSKISIKKV